ncbi:hypothetical protein B9Z55_026198 [Caenorhabditis nigoni]|uniref:Uncharacterized protein n=1 Tax=Caenorhabditis nigoni TaxID=1611254 RepID=A0A2G5T280_9PELO|nr:hypothetical protein B9Z55_026198 [Caenorhabditis nigoni]
MKNGAHDREVQVTEAILRRSIIARTVDIVLRLQKALVAVAMILVIGCLLVIPLDHLMDHTYPSEYAGNIDFNKDFEYAGDDVSNLEPASPAAYWNGDRHANGNNNNSRSPGPYNPIGSISSSSSSSSSSSRASSLARSVPLGDIMPVAGENNHLENRRVGFMGMERIPTAQDVRQLIRHHTASIAMLKEYANQMGYRVEWYVKE